MKKQARIDRPVARAKAKSIAWATAIVCAGTLLPSLAQTGAGATKALAAADRNLQVQSGAVQKVNNSQRVALVIGNAAYKDAPLTNPVNDARAIALALQESGFSVIIRENLDQRGMLAVLREFGDRLRAGGTGLFYYAGHGMQIKGRNYLIPVGGNIDREDEVAYSAVDAQAVLDKMKAAGNVANIMILDACRNNPFTRSMRSGQAGLAQMDAPVGTLLAYATSPGAVASDGGGANGLYTQHLLTAIRQPGSKVEDVFKQVRANVRRDSQGKQVPWESTSLEGDFYFKAGPVATAPVDPTQEAEAVLWNAVKDSKVPIELRVYLNRYPIGKFASAALARLDQLQRTAVDEASAEANRKAAAQRAAAEASQKAAAERARAEASQKSAAERLAAEAKQKAAAERVAAEAARKDAAERAAMEASERAAIQAAVDKRTEELLASLAVPVATSAATKPANGKPGRPAGVSNKAGFTVGDRWRYQMVDKWKKEVVSNYSRQVNGFNSDGSIKLDSGAVEWTGDGAVKAIRFANGYLREFSPAEKLVPSTFQVGFSESVKHKLVWREPGGKNGIEERDGTLKVLAKEMIKVPAGEFEAWKIEFSGFLNGTNLSTNTPYVSRFVNTIWYVPALRNYAIIDMEYRDQRGNLSYFERHELTSFSVRGAENLAQR